MLQNDPPAVHKPGTLHSVASRLALVAVEVFLTVLIPVATEAQSSVITATDLQLPDAPSAQSFARPADEPKFDPIPGFTPPERPSAPSFKFSQPKQPLEAFVAEGIAPPLPRPPIHIDLARLIGHANAAIQPALREEPRERYHWKGLFMQSLGFVAIEDAVRMKNDASMRYLIADKPYWHDYIASLHQFNMGRWNDGDSFLVNYIGHPLQGSVASLIEIQNSPRYRNVRLGASGAYWKSRFIAMLWSAVYSTASEIGPLGEAALGNEGGYTYVSGCKSPCSSYVPGVTKYTNNTGWVDFIVTPTAGTLWLVMEDAIDRFISDPVQERHPSSPFPKILRGGLNPSRTMANSLRFRKPWYRDFQHPEVVSPPAVHFVRSEEEQMEIRSRPRVEIFPHFNAISLPVNTANCSSCRHVTTGFGIGFSRRILDWIDFDSDVNFQPKASPLPSYRAGGSIVSGTFGFRFGIQTPNYALKAAIRPGFVSYDRAYFLTPEVYTIQPKDPALYPEADLAPASPPEPPEVGRITHFATALVINADYGLSHHLAMRASFGNTAVRYKTEYLDRPPGVGTPPSLYFISPNVFATNSSWGFQMGPVLRF